MIEEEFVSYEIAKTLKEMGFNKTCFAWYCNDMNILYSNLYNGNPIAEFNMPPIPKQLDCYVPLIQQVIDWFAINKNIEINATSWKKEGTKDVIIWYVSVNKLGDPCTYKGKTYESRRGALIGGIEEAIKLK